MKKRRNKPITGHLGPEARRDKGEPAAVWEREALRDVTEREQSLGADLITIPIPLYKRLLRAAISLDHIGWEVGRHVGVGRSARWT